MTEDIFDKRVIRRNLEKFNGNPVSAGDSVVIVGRCRDAGILGIVTELNKNDAEVKIKLQNRKEGWFATGEYEPVFDDVLLPVDEESEGFDWDTDVDEWEDADDDPIF